MHALYIPVKKFFLWGIRKGHYNWLCIMTLRVQIQDCDKAMLSHRNNTIEDVVLANHPSMHAKVNRRQFRPSSLQDYNLLQTGSNQNRIVEN